MISVVVPAYNESKGIPLLLERLTRCADWWDELSLERLLRRVPIGAQYFLVARA